MRKLLLCTALVVTAAAIGGCGINEYDPQEGVTIVTSPTPTRGIISGLPTTPRLTTPTPASRTTTIVVPPPPPPVLTTVLVVPLPPPVVTTTVVVPPPPPAARPASQTLSAGPGLRRCGGTRIIMGGSVNSNGTPIGLSASGLRFEGVPSIPVEGAIVQTTNPSTDEFTGYILPLTRNMIGTGNGQSLDFGILVPEVAKSVVLCDTPQ